VKTLSSFPPIIYHDYYYYFLFWFFLFRVRREHAHARARIQYEPVQCLPHNIAYNSCVCVCAAHIMCIHYIILYLWVIIIIFIHVYNIIYIYIYSVVSVYTRARLVIYLARRTERCTSINREYNVTISPTVIIRALEGLHNDKYTCWYNIYIYIRYLHNVSSMYTPWAALAKNRNNGTRSNMSESFATVHCIFSFNILFISAVWKSTDGDGWKNGNH